MQYTKHIFATSAITQHEPLENIQESKDYLNNFLLLSLSEYFNFLLNKKSFYYQFFVISVCLLSALDYFVSQSQTRKKMKIRS